MENGGSNGLNFYGTQQRLRNRSSCARLSRISIIPLTLPLAIHCTCASLALMTNTHYPLLPVYFFSNMVMLISGIWATGDLTKLQPLLLYVYTIILSCVVDCIQIGVFFSRYNEFTLVEGGVDRSIFLLSSIAVFTHLALKPFILAYAIIIVVTQACS